MNFELFDDDFESDKASYLKEISKLESLAIEERLLSVWQEFVLQTLTNTRNYFLLKTALKTMINLNNALDYDNAVFNALSFMPDQTFLETTIMIVAKYHNKGGQLAKHFNVDVSEIQKAEPKDKKQNNLQKKKPEKLSSFGKIFKMQGNEENEGFDNLHLKPSQESLGIDNNSIAKKFGKKISVSQKRKVQTDKK